MLKLTKLKSPSYSRENSSHNYNLNVLYKNVLNLKNAGIWYQSDGRTEGLEINLICWEAVCPILPTDPLTDNRKIIYPSFWKNGTIFLTAATLTIYLVQCIYIYLRIIIFIMLICTACTAKLLLHIHVTTHTIVNIFCWIIFSANLYHQLYC